MVLLVLFILFGLTHRCDPEIKPPEPEKVQPAEVVPVVPEVDSTQWKCAALVAFSEASIDTTLMRRVLWVTRLRVETNFRGDDWCEVMKSPYQYSTFDPDMSIIRRSDDCRWEGEPVGECRHLARKYRLLNMEIEDRSQIGSWDDALRISKRIMRAPISNNIWGPEIRKKDLDLDPLRVRHFAENHVDNEWTREYVVVFRDEHFTYYGD